LLRRRDIAALLLRHYAMMLFAAVAADYAITLRATLDAA